MKKLAAIGLAAAIGTASLTATSAPAKADAGLFIGGLIIGAIIGEHHQPFKRIFHHRSHSGWHGGASGHVSWCESRYQTYNPHTNLYYYKPGLQKHCVSPYS
jgi:hypothetical protein